MQQNCPMMPTVDELRRAENGDPWAVLLVGILRTAPSNHAVHLTPAAAGSRDDNDTEPQAQVTADR